MKILLTIIFSAIFSILVKGQKQCFTKKTNPTSDGPLKLSLSDPIKDFQSGSYTIVNKNINQSQRYTCFNITFLYINGKNPYEVVASIQNVQNYQDKEGLDFSVRFSPNPTVIEGLFIMSKTAIWASATIHYVITGREDFRVGTFVPQTAQLLPCGKQSHDLIINHKLIKPWNASKKLIFGLPFLSGIRTIDSQINVNFNKSMFNPQTSLLQIPVKFEQVQYPVQYLLISYLIVTMDSQFQITNIYDLDYIPTDINVFVGMTGVKTAPTSATSNTPSGVLKSSGSIITNKNKFRQFFEVQGLVIQSTSNLDILFSKDKYFNNQTIQCISSQKCSNYDGYMKYYQNQDGFVFKSQCILCQKYASYNNVTGLCQCRQLYVKINGQCIQKQKACDKTSQVWNDKNQKCQCAQGYIDKNGLCVLSSLCPPGFTSFKGTCYRVSKPTDNKTLNTTNIIASSNKAQNDAASVSSSIQQCQPPMIWNQSLKICQCPQNTYLDDSTKKCLSCRQNEVYNIKTKICQCISGSFRINGVCDFCSQYGFFNGTGCQCLPGYIGNGKICRSDPKFLNETLGLAGNTDSQSGISSNGNLSKQQSKPVIIGTININ